MSYPNDDRPRKHGLTLKAKVGIGLGSFVLVFLGLAAVSGNDDDDDYEDGYPGTSQYQEEDDD